MSLYRASKHYLLPKSVGIRNFAQGFAIMTKNTIHRANVTYVLMNKRHAGLGSQGAGLVEYALVITLVALVAVIVLGLAGVGVQLLYGVGWGVIGGREKSSGGGISGQGFKHKRSNWYVKCQGLNV